MIVIGTVELNYTKKRGEFYCPNCRVQRSYRRKTRRLFLTLYFVPLIPLKVVREFVACATCKQEFDVGITDRTPEEIQAQQRATAIELVRRALIVIVAADDAVTDEELDAVKDFCRANELDATDSEQVLREAAMVRKSGIDASAYLRHVAGQLSPEDKEILVEHAFIAATAGGELTEERQKLLKDLPEALGISEDDFRDMVVRATNR